MEPFRVFAIAGSARSASLNRKLLAEAVVVLRSIGAVVDHWDVAETAVPMYEQRLEESGSFPDVVKNLRERIQAAEGVLFASPEYNAGVTPLLKSIIDWGSRTDPETGARNVWPGRAVVVVGASPGSFGTARVQIALRQTFAHVGLLMLGEGVTLVQADQAFDSEDRLTDEFAIKQVQKVMARFVQFGQALRTL